MTDSLSTSVMRRVCGARKYIARPLGHVRRWRGSLDCLVRKIMGAEFNIVFKIVNCE